MMSGNNYFKLGDGSLSKKKIVFAKVLQGGSVNDVAYEVAGLLKTPFSVKTGSRDKKKEKGFAKVHVRSYGGHWLKDGTWGHLLGISGEGSEVQGIFFFKEGTNCLTEVTNCRTPYSYMVEYAL